MKKQSKARPVMVRDLIQLSLVANVPPAKILGEVEKTNLNRSLLWAIVRRLIPVMPKSVVDAMTNDDAARILRRVSKCVSAPRATTQG